MVIKPQIELSPEELLIQHKEEIFINDIEASKERQRMTITRCNNEIGYFKAQITKYEQQVQIAQELLDELEKRYPVEITE